MTTCPECAEDVQEGVDICPWCSSPLRPSKTTAAIAPEAQPAGAPAPRSEDSHPFTEFPALVDLALHLQDAHRIDSGAFPSLDELQPKHVQAHSGEVAAAPVEQEPAAIAPTDEGIDSDESDSSVEPPVIEVEDPLAGKMRDLEKMRWAGDITEAEYQRAVSIVGGTPSAKPRHLVSAGMLLAGGLAIACSTLLAPITATVALGQWERSLGLPASAFPAWFLMLALGCLAIAAAGLWLGNKAKPRDTARVGVAVGVISFGFAAMVIIHLALQTGDWLEQIDRATSISRYFVRFSYNGPVLAIVGAAVCIGGCLRWVTNSLRSALLWVGISAASVLAIALAASLLLPRLDEPALLAAASSAISERDSAVKAQEAEAEARQEAGLTADCVAIIDYWAQISADAVTQGGNGNDVIYQISTASGNDSGIVSALVGLIDSKLGGYDGLDAVSEYCSDSANRATVFETDSNLGDG